jgi:hypothetical protein
MRLLPTLLAPHRGGEAVAPSRQIGARALRHGDQFPQSVCAQCQVVRVAHQMTEAAQLR